MQNKTKQKTAPFFRGKPSTPLQAYQVSPTESLATTLETVPCPTQIPCRVGGRVAMGGWVARMKNTQKEGKKSKGNLKMEEKQKKNTFFMKKHLRGVSWDVWQKKNINLSKCLKDHQQIDVMMSWFHVSFSGCKYWIISPSEPGTSRRFSWSTMACCH